MTRASEHILMWIMWIVKLARRCEALNRETRWLHRLRPMLLLSVFGGFLPIGAKLRCLLFTHEEISLVTYPRSIRDGYWIWVRSCGVHVSILLATDFGFFNVPPLVRSFFGRRDTLLHRKTLTYVFASFLLASARWIGNPFAFAYDW